MKWFCLNLKINNIYKEYFYKNKLILNYIIYDFILIILKIIFVNLNDEINFCYIVFLLNFLFKKV